MRLNVGQSFCIWPDFQIFLKKKKSNLKCVSTRFLNNGLKFTKIQKSAINVETYFRLWLDNNCKSTHNLKTFFLTIQSLYFAICSCLPNLKFDFAILHLYFEIEFISHNSQFIFHNPAFVSCNSECISHNSDLSSELWETSMNFEI